MRTLISLFALGGLLFVSVPASACIPIPLSRIAASADAVVIGRYEHDPELADRGRIVIDKVVKGKRRKVVDIVWDLSIFESDPIAAQCAVGIPRDGDYGEFWLKRSEEGVFFVIGRAWAKDPNEPEEDNEND
jgi:hypothetical protein